MKMARKQGYEKGAGVYSDSDAGLTKYRGEIGEGNPPTKDLSKTVERQSNVNDGYSGPLTNE